MTAPATVTIVPQDYRFDPETEDLLAGDELQDGMLVLVEQGYRADESQEYSNGRLLEKNRWYVVSKVRSDDDNITFIGADGQKALYFSSHIGTAWVVKKNSIPTEPVTVDGDESLHDRVSVDV